MNGRRLALISILAPSFGKPECNVGKRLVPRSAAAIRFWLAANRAYCFKCGGDAISARELAPNGVKQILGRSLSLFDCLSPCPALHRPILQHRICRERQEGRSAATTRVLPR